MGRSYKCFKTSGAIIEKIVRGFIDDIHQQLFIESDKYVSLFEKLKGIESRAFKILLPAYELNKTKSMNEIVDNINYY